ncbi:hypothetical protein ACFL7D_01550 [candidate division KSB1 bacterium]
MVKFIKHLSEIPLDFQVSDITQSEEIPPFGYERTGLTVTTDNEIKKGSKVKINFPLRDKIFDVHGIVEFCKKTRNRYEFGVVFRNSEDELRTRLIEQAYYIDKYRCDIEINEGRSLTGQEAAMEWIEKFAKDFA